MHPQDLLTSRALLNKHYPHNGGRALECGAGIGRVTVHLLSPKFDKIDIIEPSAVQLNVAKQAIDPEKLGV